MTPGPETILAAAIRHEGLVYTKPPPARHIDIFPFIVDYVLGKEKQGFITSKGRFVSRREARTIAETAGQILPGKPQSSQLFSEDLW